MKKQTIIIYEKQNTSFAKGKENLLSRSIAIKKYYAIIHGDKIEYEKKGKN